MTEPTEGRRKYRQTLIVKLDGLLRETKGMERGEAARYIADALSSVDTASKPHYGQDQ